MIMGADSTGVSDSNPFWEFSLALYRRPGVAGQCIELQDSLGLDVNLLLYACYAAACGVRLSASDIDTVESGIRHWRETTVRPLRKLRRHSTGQLKEKLLEAELAAERTQQGQMWAERSPVGDWPPAGAASDLLGTNLDALAAAADIPAQRLDSFRALVDRVLAGALTQG
jgi:uncharacterized protein (TIGR02444 family)